MPILKSIMELKFLKSPMFWVFATLVVGIGGYSYVFEELPKQQAEAQQKAQLAALLTPITKPTTLGERTKEADCHIEGSLPDHACSPGAVFENITKEIICVSGYTKTVRNVSTNLRKKVFAEYDTMRLMDRYWD